MTCQLDCHDLDVTAYVKSDSLDLSASTFMSMENIACVRDLRGKISIYNRPFIATTVKSPMKRGRSIILQTAETTFEGSL